MQRIRLTYSRSAPMRYTGHLDMQNVWERTFRRARLPLAYSQGFHPQPRIHQACPLPLGMTSRKEIVDFWLEAGMPLETIQANLFPALPPGMEPLYLEEVDLRAPALQTMVTASEYTALFLVDFDADDLNRKVGEINASVTLPRIRRDKEYDLRPLILSLSVLQIGEPNKPHIQMLLNATPGATGRPEEVVSALGMDPLDALIERSDLVLSPTGEPSI